MSNQPTGENPNPPSSTGARRLMKLTSLIDMSVNTVRGKWIKISRSKAGLLLTHTAYPVWFTNVRDRKSVV